jgi:hypothetical protein
VQARQKDVAAAAEEAAGRRRELEGRRREALALRLAAKSQRKALAQVWGVVGGGSLLLVWLCPTCHQARLED